MYFNLLDLCLKKKVWILSIILLLYVWLNIIEWWICLNVKIVFFFLMFFMVFCNVLNLYDSFLSCSVLRGYILLNKKLCL